MSKCQCSMAISITGDGCRYCQPQEYIDRVSECLQENREEASSLEAERDTLRKQLDEAMKLLRIAASGASCNSVHHDKKDQHAYDEQCPVLHSIYAWLEANNQRP